MDPVDPNRRPFGPLPDATRPVPPVPGPSSAVSPPVTGAPSASSPVVSPSFEGGWAPPARPGYDGSHAYVAPAGQPGPAWTPPPAPAPRRRTGRVALAAVAAAVLVGGGVGIGAAVTREPSTTTASGTTATPDSTNRSTQQFPGFPGSSGSGSGSGSAGSGSADSGSGSSSGTSGSTGTGQSATSAATDDQSTGIVVIDTVLGYQNASAAGTGMVIAGDGTVLTNNHVVEGSTSIKVTVVSTGRTYNATVVGTDATDDVAVIKLTDASGLATVSTATTSNISAGTSVVAVGNAGGTGSLTAAAGTVTATGQSITATDESGANAENLTGLLQTDAAIEAGDSGGPLYDTSGDVIGIDTAAATTRSGTTTAGYAIPIANALTIARQIVAGDDTDAITLGLPAFLGVSLSSDGGAATVAGVIDGLPAAQAGLAAGDTITAIGDTPIASATALSDAMAALSPGAKVSVTWTTAAGAGRTATVTVVAGPAA